MVVSNPDSIVTVENLVIRAADGSGLVKGVSFDIPRGGSLGLVGESGSGKSLSALAIIGLLPPGLTATGTIQVDGLDIVDRSEPELRKLRGSGIGIVFQDPFSALNPVFTIRHQMHAVIRAHESSSQSRRQREALAAAALADVGLTPPQAFLDKYPFQLSGGQAQRVAIAMALIPEPVLLIADEPTTALDVTVQDGILRLLEGLRESRHLSLLFISHDLAVVARICGQMCIMQAGLVVEAGPTGQILTNPQTPYTRLLLDSVVDFRTLGLPTAQSAGSGAVR
jgi:ABC-type dipeptide/oligopeptide/nickel transport system ATPase component